MIWFESLPRFEFVVMAANRLHHSSDFSHSFEMVHGLTLIALFMSLNMRLQFPICQPPLLCVWPEPLKAFWPSILQSVQLLTHTSVYTLSLYYSVLSEVVHATVYSLSFIVNKWTGLFHHNLCFLWT